MRSEHERELSGVRMKKIAQDEIIAALKEQNKQLERQLPMHHPSSAAAKYTQVQSWKKFGCIRSSGYSLYLLKLARGRIWVEWQNSA